MARRLVAACIKQDTAHVGPFCSFFLTIADRPSSECRKEGGGSHGPELRASIRVPCRCMVCIMAAVHSILYGLKSDEEEAE